MDVIAAIVTPFKVTKVATSTGSKSSHKRFEAHKVKHSFQPCALVETGLCYKVMHLLKN